MQAYIDQSLITIIKIASKKSNNLSISSNFNLKDFFFDLKKLIEQYSPAKIIFDSFTSFSYDANYNSLYKIFLEIQEYFQERGINSLFVFGENETAEIQKNISDIMKLSTACIYLSRNNKQISKYNLGRMQIIPNTSYLIGEFSSKYYIKINHGILVEDEANSIISDN